MKNIKINIDDRSGVCGGVRRATNMIEEKLNENNNKLQIYVNGELLHNRLEMERLQSLGLNVEENIEKITDSCLFFRAHGVGKKAFEIAKSNNNKIVDATCPKVKNSQQIIEKYHNLGYQIVIVGKELHPEVKGLLGHCNDEGVCIITEEDCVKIDFDKDTLILAQTTVSREVYNNLLDFIGDKFNKKVEVPNTLCSFVENRGFELQKFAKKCDMVIFIGGSNSSNTKVMFSRIKEINDNSHLIENPDEIDFKWIKNNSIIGISGSASTPLWQINKVKEKIEEYLSNYE